MKSKIRLSVNDNYFRDSLKDFVSDLFGVENIFGLIFSCPFEKALPDCPFEKYRKLNKKNILIIFKNIPIHEKLELIKYHHICLRFRESKER